MEARLVFYLTLLGFVILIYYFYFYTPTKGFILKFTKYIDPDEYNVVECPRVNAKNQWIHLDDKFFERARNKTIYYKKPHLTSSLQCSRIIKNDLNYIKSLTRVTYQDSPNIKIDCLSIRRRNYFPKIPNSKKEAVFPIAYTRLVFRDYLFLEMSLAAEYAPQNFYCYVLDKKSSKEFKYRVRNLSKCFPNVMVAEKEFDTDSSGKNMNFAYMECLRVLSDFPWNYVILLQNHDVILKTNYEIVQIFKWFCGTNDVQAVPPFYHLLNMKLDYSFAGLNLFKNTSRNTIGAYNLPPKMVFGKGHSQNSLSRQMVDFMLNELDLTKFLANLEGHYGIDEHFLASLQVTEALGAPGTFTDECIKRNIKVGDVTRYTFWGYDNAECFSGLWRHSICIIGVEDLTRLVGLPHLFINKMIPQSDFGAITCWYEYMHNRTYLHSPSSKNLDKKFYLSLPHIKFHYDKLLNNGKINRDNIICNVNISNGKFYIDKR